MNIPFYSFKRQYAVIKNELSNEFDLLFDSNQYEPELWGYIEHLEKSYALYCDSKYAIGTDSGTGALQLSLLAAGVKLGDEVITTSNTYIATALAISNVGAKPVFVDIESNSFNIDPELIEEKITDKTKAIIPVHLYGQSADLDPIIAICKKHGLILIEDACQAHGSTYKNKKVGSIGDIGCFSFYSSKNLSGFGNGGMVVTNDMAVINKIRVLKNPEANSLRVLQSRRTPAYLDSIQAAFIKAKLKYLDEWNNERIRIAKIYSDDLKNIVKVPIESKYTKHTYHSYVIRTSKRNELKAFLSENRIGCSIEYTPLIHLTKTFSPLGYKAGDLPVSEKAEKEILSLPIYPGLKDIEVRYISKKIKEFLN